MNYTDAKDQIDLDKVMKRTSWTTIEKIAKHPQFVNVPQVPDPGLIEQGGAYYPYFIRRVDGVWGSGWTPTQDDID